MKHGIILSIFLLHISSAFGNRISELKCKEYESVFPSISSRNADNSSEVDDPREFPFMVKIYPLFKSPEVYYNGLLISKKFVLTVGLLRRIVPNSRSYVLLGDYVNRTDVTHQRFSITKHESHHLGLVDDELLLLKLNASVEFNQYVRPICLSQPEDDITESLLEVSWGIHKMLRKEHRDLLPSTMCSAFEGFATHGSVLCARRMKSVCEDHWSDVMLVSELYENACALLNSYRSNGSNKLVAIKVRKSYFSCRRGFLEEYVRISSYIDWIEKEVWPAKIQPSYWQQSQSVLVLAVIFVVTIVSFIAIFKKKICVAGNVEEDFEVENIFDNL